MIPSSTTMLNCCGWHSSCPFFVTLFLCNITALVQAPSALRILPTLKRQHISSAYSMLKLSTKSRESPPPGASLQKSLELHLFMLQLSCPRRQGPHQVILKVGYNSNSSPL
eukprot:scaffold18569_cov15-Tisochrysis_lutea.AAC.1